MFQLRGRAAMVTGGTDGIGAAIAESLSAAGANLLLVGREEDDAAHRTLENCRAHGVLAEACYLDLAQPTKCVIDQLLPAVERSCLSIDLLVNNVGTYREPSFLEVDLETYERTLRLNVTLGFFLTQAFALRWIQNKIEGRVLFTGSVNGLLSEPCHAAYDTSKGAVAAMVRSLCVELAPHRIRVNSLAPGLIRTPLTEPALKDPMARVGWRDILPMASSQRRKRVGQQPCFCSAMRLSSSWPNHLHRRRDEQLAAGAANKANASMNKILNLSFVFSNLL